MEHVGYVASALVLLTFAMKHMIPLRIVALASNVAFLTYGLGMQLMPVVVLHCALVPINVHHLLLAVRERRTTGAQRPRGAPTRTRLLPPAKRAKSSATPEHRGAVATILQQVHGFLP